VKKVVLITNGLMLAFYTLGKTLLEMVMGILTLKGNLPRTGCVIVSKTWKKKFRKSIGIFIINATEILPYLKISHENNIFLW
jgi:hypothetical protein